MFIRVWRFRPNPQKVSEFETVYGANGDWANLFRLSNGFIGTELVQSASDSSVYITIDRWVDSESWEEFKVSYSHSYHELDEKCQKLTIEENEIGTFKSTAT